jgi:hypothetical protein
MIHIWKNVLGVFVGFVTVVATSIVLSLLSLAIFTEMLTKNAPLDILTTSTGPLVYSLFALFVAIVVGVFVTSQLSKRVSIINSIAVVVVYGLYAYWLSQSPSNLEKPYPGWYVISSYVLLFPAALIGHLISEKMSKNA